jgi:hypothetical protein
VYGQKSSGDLVGLFDLFSVNEFHAFAGFFRDTQRLLPTPFSWISFLVATRLSI